MALNPYMHPRNPYAKKRPDFKALANKFDQFGKHTTQGKNDSYHLDFKNPECLRALSWALLKDDFDLDVEMPLDRLIPTIPLRLNYILWIEDLLGEKSADVHGIDIGCGSSCVYPLLGARKNGWNFTATEKDGNNSAYATANVEKNNLQNKIKVIKVDEGTILIGEATDERQTYDFVLCNPPFFGSNLEAWGMAQNHRDNRPDPKSVSTASPVESIIPGGEVNFVKHMITDSLVLKDKIRVYTTMLGKKSSLPVLKEELRKSGITNVGTTQFCQGRTMRWGLGWSFCDDISLSKTKNKPKKNKALTHHLPSDKDVEGASSTVLNLIKELKLSYITTESKPGKQKSWEITAINNTWSNQRRKRRSEQRAQVTSPMKQSKSDEEESDTVQGQTTDTNKEMSESAEKTKNGSEETKPAAPSVATPAAVPEESGIVGDSSTGNDFLFKCTTTVRKDGESVALELTWIDGQIKENMHQLFQYFINKLSPPKIIAK